MDFIDEEKIRELNAIRKYLEISKNEFKILLLLAFKYKLENGEYIHEENMYEIVEEALNNMDYSATIDLDDDIKKAKTIKEAFDRALVNLGYKSLKKSK